MHQSAGHAGRHGVAALACALLLTVVAACSSPGPVAHPGAAVLQVDRSVGYTTTAHDAATRLSAVPLPDGLVAVVDDHWVPDEHSHDFGALHFMFRRWDGTHRPDDGFSVALRSAPAEGAAATAACAAAVHHVDAALTAVGHRPLDLRGTASRCERDMRAMAHAAVAHDDPVRVVAELDSGGRGADGGPYLLHVSLAVLGAPGVLPQLALTYRYSPDFTALAQVPQA